jgi:hypothetical protein
MVDLSKKVRILVASPGDVQSERDELSKVVNELNLTISAIAPEKGIVLELIRYETHAYPGLGEDAQDVINKQALDYDIFVGIMWKRFGTPTKRAGSGTAEEFQYAYERWTQNNSLPVLFYFRQTPFMPKTADEVAQLGKVLTFRDEMSQSGLVWEYEGDNTFAGVIRPHLILVLSRMFSRAASPAEAAESAVRSSPESDLEATRRRVEELAQTYDRLRATMPSGRERTSQMSKVASQLRTMALSIYPLLPDLMDSPSAGARLAAVSALEELPNPKHLTWLAQRLGVEQPYLGYRASQALLSAARRLGGGERHREVQAAVEMASGVLAALSWQDPNQVALLDIARRVLGEKSRALSPEGGL